ncbi:hypothetical protein BZB76_3273 [Actinomadura pelletieri DSM 43383]|uniref:Dolichyl-phosphate-mannose-protein mannosyltransferase n=1 Tax=Actinomadura pelletieri DSM 43383 TaxID=1120940 RepID=A0A495QP52_9ACTN|nr:hypothetical protein [Actinomadura pelletieri]RKS74754.1 hypothetical protein BZB76_3273 [Actinomadura pelletieri DSM 43383]
MTTTLLRPVRTGRPAPPRRMTLLLVVGALVQVVVRLWFARDRTGSAANPDENGYLTAARWLTGGPGGDFSGQTFYQGGYSLLLTPAYWLADDPVTVYRIVMLINAVAGAALFPLGYAAARRLGLTRHTAAPLAFAATLLPATTFFGCFALVDAVLPTLVLAWLLALDRFARAGRGDSPTEGDIPRPPAKAHWAAMFGSLVASYAVAVHTRGMVVLAVHVIALVAVAAIDRRKVRAAVAGVGVTLAGYAAAAALNAQIRDALYPGGIRDLAGILESRLTTLSGQGWTWAGAAGQIWYLIVSTWGLAGIGLVVVAAALSRRGTPAAEKVMPAVLLAVTFGIAYASSGALPDEHRVGNFAYGRYLSCLALVYTLVGAAALVRSGGRTALTLVAASALAIQVTGLWVLLHAGERLRTHKFIGFDFPETMFLTGDRTALHLHEAALAASVLLCGLLALSRLREQRHAAAAVAAALAGVNVAAMTFLMG